MILTVVNTQIKNEISKESITHDFIRNKIVLAQLPSVIPGNTFKFKLCALFNHDKDEWVYHWMGLNDTIIRWNNTGYTLKAALGIDNAEIRIIDTIAEMCDLLKNWR